MQPKDSITIFLLTLGCLLGTVILLVLRRNRSKPEVWPWIFGIGAAFYMFISSMTASIMLRPPSNIAVNVVESVLWALALGAVGYYSGRIFARRKRGHN